MPLHIIKNDITRVHCDAIVNAANCSLLGGGGVDGAIHRAAGRQLLEECKTLGGCETGDAKITKGYNLPCKYVIHTVGPIWQGGNCSEEELLQSCYQKSLALAKEYACETVAFPLISSGVYGYPKKEALSVAVQTISDFLLNDEMTVYIVLLDSSACQIDKELYSEVEAYIDRTLFSDRTIGSYSIAKPMDINACCSMDLDEGPSLPRPCAPSTKPSLEKMLSEMDDTFAVTLLKLIDLKGMTDVECYKKANVSKQTWYKILNEKNYKPSKNTVIAFAIALELTLKEANGLLATVGFTLSKSSIFDVIIEYFLIHREYDIFLINETLFKFDQVCLGV
jgi:O-acetyl-ADP-ribose deacetylase (regulator of RNase III)/DNA-binding phage protein